MNIAQTLQVIPKYAALTEFINAANKRNRIAFRVHCEELFGHDWRVLWRVEPADPPHVYHVPVRYVG